MLLANTPVGPAPARSNAATCCFRKSLLRWRWLSGPFRNWMRRNSRITVLAASAAAALPAASVEAAAGRNARLVIEPAWYQTCGRKMETAPIPEKPEPGKSSIHRGDAENAEISAEKTKQKQARRKGQDSHLPRGARGGSGDRGGNTARRGHFGGHAHSLLHAARVGAVFSGDVEGRAVIDGGADDRNAERDVHGFFEVDQFHRDVALIVVHGDDQVKGAANRLQENRVGSVRPAAGNALGARGSDRWDDDSLFLVAEKAMLAGVRVQAADGDARPRA